MESVRDMGYKPSQMAALMRGIGNRIKLVGREKLNMKMETASKGSGLKEQLMDLEYIYIETVQYMRDIGLITCRVAKECNPGLMAASTRASISRGKSMEKVSIIGPMAATILENGTKTTFMDMGSITGVMDVNTKVNGGSIRCMDLAFILGMTAEATKANTITIKSKDSANIAGRMDVSLKATGSMASVKVRENLLINLEKPKREFGRMTSDGIGLERNLITIHKLTIRSRFSLITKRCQFKWKDNVGLIVKFSND